MKSHDTPRSVAWAVQRPVGRLVGAATLTTAILAAGWGLLAAASTADEPLEFTDVRAQTLEFIGYYESIELTAEQEQVKYDALSAIPAPCCNDNSAYTCCCPCNMAKSWWGLSHYLIADRGYGVEEVRSTVQEWIAFINPDGFPGDTCYTNACSKPFRHGGCGGMSDAHVVF